MMMKKKDKAVAAILAVFPTREAYAEFAERSENAKAVESFVRFAAKNKIIESATSARLETFIAGHARSVEQCTPPPNLTIEELLEKREELLRFNLSVRAMAERINNLIAENLIDLPRVSNPMLTRLKTKAADTPYKQNVLRTLAFWLGHERSDLGPRFNYEALRKLCPEYKATEQQKEGIRIGFSLSSRGDVVDHAVMNWLKKAIKNHLDKTMSEQANGQWGKVRSHDFTTVHVDFSKERAAVGPVSYRLGLKNAVSLAHQIAIRWSLSKYCTRNRFLSIGIVAGEFAVLDNYLLLILNAKLAEDPVIRVSDYVRQCLLINDIKVILCRKPSETTLFNGEAFGIWWITAFWNSLYFDFIPELLDEEILQNRAKSRDILSQLLMFPEDLNLNFAESDESNAVMTFFKFPHNTLLGVEIAKTLFYRRRYHEALEILRIVLSIDPIDPTARTLRMSLFRQLAIDAPSYSVTEKLLNHAEHEALYIQEKCEILSEDFYCEYAALYLTRAVSTVKHLRANGGAAGASDAMRESVFKDLDRSEYLFDKAMTVSPSAIRSSYSLNLIRVLKTILLSDAEILVNPRKPLDCNPRLVKSITFETHQQLNFMAGGVSSRDLTEHTAKLMVHRFRIYGDSVSLRSYRPCLYFTHAVALWDFSPARTVAIAGRVLKSLSFALESAHGIEKDDVCIYSSTGLCNEMMPAAQFIRHIENSIQMVREIAGDNLAERNEDEMLDSDPGRAHLLMTLNF